MKLAYKIVLVNLAIAIGITVIGMIVSGGGTAGEDFALAFGLACLAMSLLNLLFGIIMLISKDKEWGTGMLVSFAILLLLSGISCSQGLQGL